MSVRRTKGRKGGCWVGGWVGGWGWGGVCVGGVSPAELRLDGNQLAGLPARLGRQLSGLARLSLSRNAFAAVPVEELVGARPP